MTRLENLVEEFARHVAAQTEEIHHGSAGKGNQHAKRYLAAFDKLCAHGNAGRDALAALFAHPRADVRVMAAAFLLRHRTTEARAVLEEAAKGRGIAALGASQTLKNWEEGTWALDPLEDIAPVPAAGIRAESARSPERRSAKKRSPSPQRLVLPRALKPHRALIEGLLAPCIRFDKEQGNASSRGCRYGGLPLVPPGTEWPHSPEGPLHFLGQLDFTELAAYGGEALSQLPQEGILAFFYDVENQPWGGKPEDSALWRLIWTPRGSEAVPLQPPAELMESDKSILPPWRLVPSRGLSLLDSFDLRAPAELGSLEEAASDAYLELREKLAGGEYVHQVGGHPAWVQDDARIEAQLVSHGLRLDGPEAWETPEAERLKPGASEWRLLWQVASDEELDLMWGMSMGNLYLLIREEDLRACRFERAWLILQGS